MSTLSTNNAMAASSLRPIALTEKPLPFEKTIDDFLGWFVHIQKSISEKQFNDLGINVAETIHLVRDGGPAGKGVNFSLDIFNSFQDEKGIAAKIWKESGEFSFSERAILNSIKFSLSKTKGDKEPLITGLVQLNALNGNYFIATISLDNFLKPALSQKEVIGIYNQKQKVMYGTDNPYTVIVYKDSKPILPF